MCLVLFGTVALANSIQAPQDSLLLANEIVIQDNFIASLSDRKGVLNDYKTLVGFYAAKYGVDVDVLSRVIMCESGFRHDGVFGDSGKAYGIAQFHKPTFEMWNKERGVDLDYYNLEDQLDLMAWAFSKGELYKKHWTCYSKLYVL